MFSHACASQRDLVYPWSDSDSYLQYCIVLVIAFIQQILRQDVGWFDHQSLGAIITKITANVDEIENGIGSRLGLCVQNLTMSLTCFAGAFIGDWKLAFVGLAVSPLIIIAFVVMGKFSFFFKFPTQKYIRSFDILSLYTFKIEFNVAHIIKGLFAQVYYW